MNPAREHSSVPSQLLVENSRTVKIDQDRRAAVDGDLGLAVRRTGAGNQPEPGAVERGGHAGSGARRVPQAARRQAGVGQTRPAACVDQERIGLLVAIRNCRPHHNGIRGRVAGCVIGDHAVAVGNTRDGRRVYESGLVRERRPHLRVRARDAADHWSSLYPETHLVCRVTERGLRETRRIVERRAVGPCQADGCARRSRGAQDRRRRETPPNVELHRPHHVVLFVPQQVAVPHVLPAEVDGLVGDCGRTSRQRVETGESGTDRLGHVVGALAVENPKGKFWSHRPHRHDDVLEWIHLDGFFPTELIGFGLPHGAVPPDSVDDLHVEQVEVDGVSVHSIVSDLPDLGPITRDGRHRGDGVGEVLCGRINVAQGNGGLIA